MARTPKAGLDYFPMQTDIGSDQKIKRLIRKGGKDAWTVFTWMLVLIYHDGYYSDADALKDSITWDFRDIDEATVERCLSIMAELDLIDKELFETERIVTSRGIQKQYLSSTKRRSDINMKDYCVLNVDNDSIPASNNPIIVNKNPIDVNKNKQTEIETEIETETEIEIENKQKQKQKSADADSSDGFNKPFSDSSERDPFETWRDPLYAASRLKRAGVDVKENTLRKVDGWVKDYDERSIDEALEVAIAKKARNIVGYMDTVLKGWAQGSGNPKWVEREEMALAEQKKEYMRPGALAKELMTTRKLE